jgi:hypothetical protein
MYHEVAGFSTTLPKNDLCSVPYIRACASVKPASPSTRIAPHSSSSCPQHSAHALAQLLVSRYLEIVRILFFTPMCAQG